MIELIKLIKLRRAHRSTSSLLGLLSTFLIFQVSFFLVLFDKSIIWSFLIVCTLFILAAYYSLYATLLFVIFGTLFLNIVIKSVNSLLFGTFEENSVTVILAYSSSYFLFQAFLHTLLLNKTDRRILQNNLTRKISFLFKSSPYSPSLKSSIYSQLISFFSLVSRGISNFSIIVLFGLFLFHAAIILPILYFGSIQLEMKNITKENLLLPILIFTSTFIISAFLFSIISKKLRSLSRNLLRNSFDKVVFKDKRKSILFLRSFKNDQVILPKLPFFRRLWQSIPDPQRLDHILIEEFAHYGPVVAIGNPDEDKLPYGAARLYVPRDEWEKKVNELADTALAIVIVADSGKGVDWEIDQMIQKHTNKTLFLASPKEKKDLKTHSKFKHIFEKENISNSVLGIFKVKEKWQVMITPQVLMDDYEVGLKVFFQNINSHDISD